MSKTTNRHWRNKFNSQVVYFWAIGKWSAINQRTVNGAYHNAPSVAKNPQHQSYIAKGITIDMSQDEFFNWCSSNETKILEMIENGERPSIDRKCPECSYSIENIQVIPLYDNMTKDRVRNYSVSHSYPNKTQVKIKNRQTYIESHDKLNRPLIIDRYINRLKEYHSGLSLLSDCIVDGMFDNAFDYTRDDYENSKLDTFIDAWIDEAELKSEVEARERARVDLKKQAINDRKALVELKRNIKIHERYDEVRSFVKRRKAVLDKGFVKKSHELDWFISENNTKTCIIHIISNDLKTEIKPISVTRNENKATILYRGISFEKATGMYLAQITHKKVKYWLGRFETQEEAVEALKNKKSEILN